MNIKSLLLPHKEGEGVRVIEQFCDEDAGFLARAESLVSQPFAEVTDADRKELGNRPTERFLFIVQMVHVDATMVFYSVARELPGLTKITHHDDPRQRYRSKFLSATIKVGGIPGDFMMAQAWDRGRGRDHARKMLAFPATLQEADIVYKGNAERFASSLGLVRPLTQVLTIANRI